MAIMLGGILAVMLPMPFVFADRPYYSSGDHIIKGVIKFQNDCWHEVYIRATPKNNNHVLLNYQYIQNNDTPDNGPSEIVTFSMYFKASKMTQTSSTNEGRIRNYVTIELQEGLNGETVTKYLSFDAGRRTIDFGTYYMHTNPALCA